MKKKSSTGHGDSNTKKSLTNIHIVVDNSNLYIGAQVGQGKNGTKDYSVRTKVADLVQIIEKNKKQENIKTRIVGGSIPPRGAKVWTEWEKCNYNCLLGERTANNKEVFLDDMLHSQIQNIILRNKVDKGKEEQHLVLITGDGNPNDNRTSFPEMVTIAINYGWTVEIWSWKASFSGNFSEIQQKYPQKFQINYLDADRSTITFREKQKPKQQQEINNIKFPINYLDADRSTITFREKQKPKQQQEINNIKFPINPILLLIIVLVLSSFIAYYFL